MIALWTAATGCDADRMRGPTRPKEALTAFSEYCPEKLQQALREQIPTSSFVTVDYCICADIPACDLCQFSQGAPGAGGGAEQSAVAQQQVASFGEVTCKVVAELGCCNCCAAFAAPGGPEQQPIK